MAELKYAKDLQPSYDLALSHNGTGMWADNFAVRMIERIDGLMGENAALKAQVGLEDLLAAKEREWWVRIGKFRKALSTAGFHGHYNLFQEHFQDESGKWEAKEREIERLKAQVSATEWALTPDEGFGTLGKVNALIAARAAQPKEEPNAEV